MTAAAPSLTLHDWASLHTELVWAYDHEPAEKSRHLAAADHTRGNWAWFMRKGAVRIESTRGVFEARAGEWLLLPAERHRHDFTDDASLISLNFICQWPAGENVFASPEPLVLADRDHPRLRQTATKLARLVGRELTGHHHLHRRQTAGYPVFLRCQRAFHDWIEAWFETRLAHGARVTRQIGDTRVLRAARLLDEAPLDAGLPRAALATVGLSLIQLNRLFRQQLKLSPRQYWERRRLEYARQRLETDDAPLKEIAFSLGFSDTPHFNVWFKRNTGATPGRHRDEHSPV
ncbi:MAG: helix-turn-helix transcriptional regulator [Verrucomicrobiota bacterium]